MGLMAKGDLPVVSSIVSMGNKNCSGTIIVWYLGWLLTLDNVFNCSLTFNNIIACVHHYLLVHVKKTSQSGRALASSLQGFR